MSNNVKPRSQKQLLRARESLIRQVAKIDDRLVKLFAKLGFVPQS